MPSLRSSLKWGVVKLVEVGGVGVRVLNRETDESVSPLAMCDAAAAAVGGGDGDGDDGDGWVRAAPP